MTFWCILSGQFDAFHLSLGVISCLLAALWSTRALFGEKPAPLRATLAILKHLPTYSLWLIKEIVLANIHVFRLAVTPGGLDEVDPKIFSLHTQLQSPIARCLLANSITLTPGTVTLRLEGSELWVHSISETTSRDLGHTIEARLARIFGETPTQPPHAIPHPHDA